jgi:hypothetical protein
MSELIATPLSEDLCLNKADETRAMAKAAKLEPHRIMLTHIAETWDRIAESLK